MVLVFAFHTEAHLLVVSLFSVAPAVCALEHEANLLLCELSGSNSACRVCTTHPVLHYKKQVPWPRGACL